jgi:putative endonuclease
VSYTGSRLIGDPPRRRVHMVLDQNIFMWYTYILESIKNKNFYIGSTDDLKRRFKEHNQGRGGKYTKKQGKFKIVFYEAYVDKKDALKAEKFFKSGYGREIIKDKLENYLKSR